MDINNLWSDFDLSSNKQNTRCLSVNTILAGKYLVGPVLGQGGFGITYIGYDLNMEARIAIKEYFPVELVSRDTTTMHGDRVLSLSGEKSITYQQGLKKYVEEAQNVSQFSEVPGIVSVKDFFYENETAYIVMEYIEGQSLKDYLKSKGGRLSEEETLRIMKPVLEALEKVHHAGIIHRDISPDNIMLTFEKDGNIKEVKLIDFGAARMTAKNDQKSLTIILKHGYAPEEQYRTHGEQGPWTDVYAVCAVLYRMLTGETPVPAMDRMFKDELKSFEEMGVNVSENTATAILKGLAVKKDDRIHSMRELTSALYEGARLKNTDAGKKKKILIAAGICAVLVIAVAVMALAGNKKTAVTNGETEEVLQEAEALENTEEQVISTEKVEEEFGEVIVTAAPQTSYDSSKSHVVILKEDGTVTTVGSNQYGQCNLGDWGRIAAVAAGDTFSAGLREDGRVLVEGELQGKEDVERWEGIIAIAGSDYHLYGLKQDGTIAANLIDDLNKDCLEWQNVTAITGGLYALSALTADGRVLCTGLGEKANEISGWNEVEFLVNNQKLVLGICKDGSVKCARMWTDETFLYDDEWLDEVTKKIAQTVETYQNIIQLSMSYDSCYGVTEEGAFVQVGNEYSMLTIEGWGNLAGVAVTDNGERIVGIQKDGTLLKKADNEGNTTWEEMEDLQKVILKDGNDGSSQIVLGITKDYQLLYEGSGGFVGGLRRILNIWEINGIQRSVKDIDEMQFVYEDEIDGETFTDNCVMLDLSGNLQMPVGMNEEKIVNEVPLTQISCFSGHTVSYVAGLSADGKVHIYNTSLYDVPEPLYEAENWTDITQVVCYKTRVSDESGILGLRKDGTVLSVTSSGESVEAVSQWKDVVSLHAGDYAAGAILADGTAVFLEDASEYNQGQYNTAGWDDLEQLALGMYHTVGLRKDGTVYAAGRNDAGQCDVSDWTDIVYVTANSKCTMGIKSDGTLVAAGEAGWE